MGAAISLSLNDQFQLGRRLAAAPEKVSAALNKTMLNVAIMFERTEKQVVPVITGRLQSSILTEKEDLRYTITPNVVYAEFVDDRRHFVQTTFEMVEPMARQEINATVKDIINSI